MARHSLTIEQIKKSFGRIKILDDVSFEVKQGEFVCLLGPSGCGKTTLLRIISGLEETDGGRIYLQDKDITHMNASMRNFGIVFQSYALFPNMTTFQNISFGLKSRIRFRKGIEAKVREVLDMVALDGMEGKYPAQLSGGEQQRVALARAIALSPDVLLLDEPLSALDAKVRMRLRSDIRTIQKEMGITTIMVTHDQEEALTMADRIILMERTRIIQEGTPQDIYEKPRNSFAADFIGMINFFDRKIFTPNTDGQLFAIRPENIHVSQTMSHGSIQATVKDLEFRGPFYRLLLSVRSDNGETTFLADVPSSQINMPGMKKDMPLFLKFHWDKVLEYPCDSLGGLQVSTS